MTRAAAAGPRDRKSIIADIETARGSKVLAYLTGDRPNGPGAMIGEDAVRPMYDHLLSIAPDGHVDKIDLFLYSRGGPGQELRSPQGAFATPSTACV